MNQDPSALEPFNKKKKLFAKIYNTIILIVCQHLVED